MTSKEALKEIVKEARFIFVYKTINGKHYTPQDLINTIKQDLERLKVLDKLVTDDCIAGNEVGLQIVNNLIERSNNYRDENKQLKERLEKLENENKELEEMLSVANYVGCGAEEKVWDLTRENEKLKEEKLYYQNKYLELNNSYQMCEDLKRKKAIEILKKYLYVVMDDSGHIINADGYLLKQEYDLLKEVLGE